MLFCKKYEEKLVEAKQKELREINKNKPENQTPTAVVPNDGAEMRKRTAGSARNQKTDSQLEFQDMLKYWNTQVVGRSKL